MGRHRWAVAAAASVLLSALPTYGAEKPGPERNVGMTSLRLPVPLDSHAMNAMLRADRDKDGTLSRDELDLYDVSLGRRFKEVDADRDGKLTLYEFEKLLTPAQTAASRR